MKIPGAAAALAAAMLLAGAGLAEAQTRHRWSIEYEQEKPRIFTYRDPLGKLENYWYLTYTVHNDNPEVVPLLLDLMLYVATGKDLLNDAGKVDSDPLKDSLRDPSKSEALRFGKFYSNILLPEEIEYKIIEHHAKIGNRSDGMIRESIEEFKRGFVEEPPAELGGRWRKGDRWYLNAREIRQHRHLQPGQTLMGIAIFRGVDLRAKRIEVQISGLYDIFRVDRYTDEETRLAYENRVLKRKYEFPGDEFERERDVLFERGSEWIVKPIGPVASKETLTSLVEALLEMLKKEEEWERGNVAPEDREKARVKENFSPLDANVSGRIIQIATGVNFGFDAGKTLMENQASVWRIHEWWVKNKSKLVYNEGTGRFDVKDDPLPGEIRDPK